MAILLHPEEDGLHSGIFRIGLLPYMYVSDQDVVSSQQKNATNARAIAHGGEGTCLLLHLERTVQHTRTSVTPSNRYQNAVFFLPKAINITRKRLPLSGRVKTWWLLARIWL